MRFVIIAATLLVSAVAWADDTPPAPAAPAAAPVAAAPAATPATPDAATPPAPGSAEEIICKRTISTGSRVKSRGRKICGTRAQWEDHNSELNRMFEGVTRTYTGEKG